MSVNKIDVQVLWGLGLILHSWLRTMVHCPKLWGYHIWKVSDYQWCILCLKVWSIGPNWTGPWSGLFLVAVAQIWGHCGCWLPHSKIFQSHLKTGFNWLQPLSGSLVHQKQLGTEKDMSKSILVQILFCPTCTRMTLILTHSNFQPSIFRYWNFK